MGTVSPGRQRGARAAAHLVSHDAKVQHAAARLHHGRHEHAAIAVADLTRPELGAGWLDDLVACGHCSHERRAYDRHLRGAHCREDAHLCRADERAGGKAQLALQHRVVLTTVSNVS